MIAPAGSGKTTLFQHLIGGALRHNHLRAYIFDRFNGTRIFTQSMGGTYIDLSEQSHTALNPFYCDNTPSNRAFLEDFLLMLAGLEEEKDSSLRQEVQRAVSLIMSLPKGQRLLNVVYKSAFSVSSSLRLGLQRWIHPSPMSHWFNGVRLNDKNESVAYDALDLNSSRLVAFEMTDIQRNAGASAAMTTYIMHRIREVVRHQACPHLIFVDETRPMLEDPLFRKHLKSDLQERRKLRGSVNLCFQDPSAIAESGMQDVILDQCPTVFLFPNPAGKREDYVMFDLTESQWNYIKGGSRITRYLKHSVLVKRKHEAVILDIDLTSLGPLLKLYRSGSEPLKLVKELQQQWGQTWVQHYLEI